MLIFMETVNLIAILLMLFMLAVILRQKPSKAQTAFILYNVFTILFVIGIHLELLHSDTVGEAVAGLSVQYLGQAGFLMSLLWFVSEFANFSVPGWIYGLEAGCNTFVLIGVFTAEKHRLFYTSMKILTDGLYNRIDVTAGILWYLHYVHLFTVLLAILILCLVSYRRSSRVQKKRVLYIGSGIGILTLELVMKGLGVFGSYNPVVIAMTLTMFCMLMAMVRYSYFGSLHAAVDNAFNHGNEGLVILDEGDNIVFVNQKMDVLFPDIHKGRKIQHYPEICRLLEEPEHLLRREGAVYELRVEDIVEHGEKSGRMLWLIDQTQGLLTMQKLREADEAKTQFLMRVSHELRTPMNTVLGMNEMIRRESSEQDIRKYAGEVADAGRHMLALIDEVLETSRLESGRLTITEEPYSPARILKAAEEMIRPLAEKKGLELRVEGAPELCSETYYLDGDAPHIQQIVVNLLSNAVKYTDKGYISLRLSGQQEGGEKRILWSVEDSGIGISPEDQGKIFENFGRGSNTDGKDGMGLGLAIVQQLAGAMGGRIALQSELGKGSCFTLFLPCREAAPEDVEAWKLSQNAGSAENPDGQIPDFHANTILVVDDNEQNLMVIRHLLRRTGIGIETACDGRTAVEACRRRRYDLILLDHMMPGMDGIETIHRLQTDEEGMNQDTKVIALTANAARGAKQRYLEEGFAGYLSKPIEPSKLENLLRHCLGDGFAENRTEQKPKQGEHMVEEKGIQTLEQYGICVQDGLRYADEDKVFYRELLTMFAKQQEERQKCLEETLQGLRENQDTSSEKKKESVEKLWKTWVTTTHALKGEARGLGAAELGELFYLLELSGREKNLSQMEKLLPETLEHWKNVTDGISRI